MIARFVSTGSVRLFTSLHTQEMPFNKDTFVFKYLSLPARYWHREVKKCMFCGNRDKGDTKQNWAVYITNLSQDYLDHVSPHVLLRNSVHY